MSNKVPEVGKAAVCVNRGLNYHIECKEDYPVPKPGRGELLLRLNVTGLCMSDVHFMKGDWGVGMQPGVDCAGHEGAGVVVALGDGVDSEKWKIGDRAGLKPLYDTCGECDLCRGGKETHCDKAPFTGAFAQGSYCQYVLSPARYTSRIPEGVPDEIAGPIMCSGATTYAALKASGARAGQWVVIPGGGGGVGHMAVQYAAAMGMRVIAIDTGDNKKQMCKALGAEAFVDFATSENVRDEIIKITGGGAHAVIVTGGTGKAYEGAHALLRKAGTMVCVGLPTRGTAFAGGDPFDLCFSNIKIVGSLVGGMDDVDEALRFAARGLIKPKITTYSFKELPDAVKLLTESKIAGRAVVYFDK